MAQLDKSTQKTHFHVGKIRQAATSLATGVHNAEEKSLCNLIIARSMKKKSSFLPGLEKKKEEKQKQNN